MRKKFLFDLANRFNQKELEFISKKDKDELENIYVKINNAIKSLNGQLAGWGKKINKTQKDTDLLNEKRAEQKLLVKYKDTIGDAAKAVKKYKEGKGIMSYFSPQELLKRFELLGRSLAAGNNGVLHEYIQIAHRLRDLGIVTNKQLSSLLRNYINIR